LEYDAQHPDRPTADGTILYGRGRSARWGAVHHRQCEDHRDRGDVTDPELDIRAKFESARATVDIVISGTAKNPQIDLTSNPPMDQDAIAVLPCHRTSRGPRYADRRSVDSRRRQQRAGSLSFGPVAQALAGAAVDVLTIETQGTGVAQASVGKYIGDRIFVGYRQR